VRRWVEEWPASGFKLLCRLEGLDPARGAFELAVLGVAECIMCAYVEEEAGRFDVDVAG